MSDHEYTPDMNGLNQELFLVKPTEFELYYTLFLSILIAISVQYDINILVG